MDYCLEYKHLNDEEHIFKSINYNELISLLDSFDTGLVFMGGAWCPNCQAIIDTLNSIGKKRGLKCIYNYDPKFINIYGEEEDLRDCKSLEVKLNYYAIVEKTGFKSDKLVVDTLIPRIPLPTIFAIKNGVCVGYYSEELIKEGSSLMSVDGTEDKTLDFAHHVISLIQKIESDRLL